MFLFKIMNWIYLLSLLFLTLFHVYQNLNTMFNQIHNGIHNVTQKIPFHTLTKGHKKDIYIVEEDESKSKKKEINYHLSKVWWWIYVSSFIVKSLKESFWWLVHSFQNTFRKWIRKTFLWEITFTFLILQQTKKKNHYRDAEFLQINHNLIAHKYDENTIILQISWYQFVSNLDE